MSQRYFFLAEIKAAEPNVDLVIHDDACHLRKFCDANGSASSIAAALRFPQVRYVVDQLHSKGHTDSWCVGNCLSTSAANVDLVKNVNTQICEQTFSMLGRHKFVIRACDRLTAAVLLHELADVRNESWLAKHQM